jgi:inosose dehydratase
MTTALRVACQSAGMWGDLDEPGALNAFLDAAADLQFAGVGLFDTHLHPYRDRPDALRAELRARDLELVAVDVFLDDDDGYVASLSDILAGAGCEILVLIGGQGTTDDDLRAVAGRLNAIGAAAARRGVTAVYHHHSDTIAATEAEVEQLVPLLDPQAVALLADTGHIAQDMAVTPDSFIRRHAARLRLVEFKEFAPERGLGYELGRGRVDFPAVARALYDIGYSGWIMVEQNESSLTPRQSAALSRAYLRDEYGW